LLLLKWNWFSCGNQRNLLFIKLSVNFNHGLINYTWIIYYKFDETFKN
jgi:hypothetical protein